MGLRERKKADTRLAIAKAAMQLAIEHGPDAITVDDIAAAADVSPRTVFNYFPTKEEAIVGFDRVRSLEVGKALVERPERERPLLALKMVFLEIATGNPEVADMSRARSQLVRDHPQLYARYAASYTALEGALVDAVAQRTGLDADRDMYPHLVVSAALAALRVALDHSHAHRQRVEDALDDAFDSLAKGL